MSDTHLRQVLWPQLEDLREKGLDKRGLRGVHSGLVRKPVPPL
jgi:hypothetical protein